MRVTRNAIADRLLSLPYVTARVGTFRGAPCIFSMSPIPPSAEGRVIVVRDAHVDEPFETKTPTDPPSDYVPTNGRVVEHDVAVYENYTGDSSELEDLAVYVREQLNRYQLSVSGYKTLIAVARGPVEAQGSEVDMNSIDGRLITVALTVIKEPS